MTGEKYPFKTTSAVTGSGMNAIAARGGGGGGAVLPEKHVVHWFRKGLRLHDNPSLLRGLEGATTLRCVFVIDPWFAGSSNVGINKWRWVERTPPYGAQNHIHIYDAKHVHCHFTGFCYSV